MICSDLIDGELKALISDNISPLQPFPTDQKPVLNPIAGIKAVVFDIYGTLLISGTGDIGIAQEKHNDFPISEILLKNNMELLVDKESVDSQFSLLINHFIKETHKKSKAEGIQYPEVDIRLIWKSIIDSMTVENYINGTMTESEILKASLTYECLVNPVWPMPGSKELLQYFYNNSKYKLGIVSNAQFYTEHILNTILDFRKGKEYFDEKMIAYSYEKGEAKPSLDFFNSVVNSFKVQHHINPQEILYIGNDMLNDVFTAQKCGCKAALFAGDKRSLRLRIGDERCKDVSPDLVITKLKQIIDLI